MHTHTHTQTCVINEQVVMSITTRSFSSSSFCKCLFSCCSLVSVMMFTTLPGVLWLKAEPAASSSSPICPLLSARLSSRSAARTGCSWTCCGLNGACRKCGSPNPSPVTGSRSGHPPRCCARPRLSHPARQLRRNLLHVQENKKLRTFPNFTCCFTLTDTWI